jgi:hypothetical protein
MNVGSEWLSSACATFQKAYNSGLQPGVLIPPGAKTYYGICKIKQLINILFYVIYLNYFILNICSFVRQCNTFTS